MSWKNADRAMSFFGWDTDFMDAVLEVLVFRLSAPARDVYPHEMNTFTHWLGVRISLMKARRFTLLVILSGLFHAVAFDALGANNGDSTLCVMTFNLRYASEKPPNAWPQRRPVMATCIRKVSPDIFGTQEGLYHQLKNLHADLPEYDWIGLGRDGGSHGEFMAIFYRKDRFDPLEYDHFWLSDTPNVVASTTWGNSNRRMVTWVRFRDRTTGREFYFWNTHLDHQIQLAREKSAALIRDRVEALKTDLPVLLTGDFNAVSGANKAYDILVTDGSFKDTWHLAKERRNSEYNSFNGFKDPVKHSQRIDWILARGPVKVDATEVVTFSQNGQFPSDHFPVAAWLRLGDDSK